MPQTNEPPLGCHYLLISWLLRSQFCTPTQCIEPISVSVPKKVARNGKDSLKKHQKWISPHLGCQHLLPSWLLFSQACTQTQCIEHISVSVPKKWRKMGEIFKKTPQTNEPPLGCHHLLPSWLLHSQICKPTQCIEPIFVSVPKKVSQNGGDSLKKCENEWAPSRWSYCTKNSDKTKMTTPWPKGRKNPWICFANSIFSWSLAKGWSDYIQTMASQRLLVLSSWYEAITTID